MAKKSKSPKNTKEDANDDWALWQSVAGQATPLPGKKLEKPAQQQSPAKEAPASLQQRAPEAVTAKSSAGRQLPELSIGSFAGLDKRTAQRLKRGQLPLEGRLDLHHMTQAEAHNALIHFISGSISAGKRTVIVITGKGLKPTGEVGVLRTMVPRWLNQAPLRAQIVAICEAAPKDGGSGVLYLRLKKFD